MLIIPKNQTDIATITQSSGNATVIANDVKSDYWQANTNNNEHITLNFVEGKHIDTIALVYHNLDNNAIVGTTYYQGNTVVHQANTVVTGVEQSNAINWHYHTGNYLTIRTPHFTNIDKIVFDFYNNNEPIQLSRLIVGKSVTTTYDADVGVLMEYNSDNSVIRTEGGDSYSISRPKRKSITLRQFLLNDDRVNLNNFFKFYGTDKPIFCNLASDNDPEMSSYYSIYGRFDNNILQNNELYRAYSNIKIVEF